MTNLEGNLIDILNMKNTIDANYIRKGIVVWNIAGNLDYNTPINFQGTAKRMHNAYHLIYIDNMPNDTIGVYYTDSNEFNGIYKSVNGKFAKIENIADALKEDVVSGTFYGNNGTETTNINTLCNVNTITNDIYKDVEVMSWLNYSISSANTAGMHNVQALFSGMQFLEEPLNLDFKNVINTVSLYADCYNMRTVDVLNLCSTENTFAMFDNCHNLTTLNYLDISNATNLQSIFYYCFNLRTVNTILTNNAVQMARLFLNCRNLLSAPSLNTLNVTNTFAMFANCRNITSVPNYNLYKVIDMKYMFTYCQNLTSVPNFKTNNVNNISYMFSDCINLTAVPNFNTSNASSMYRMFDSCFKLVSVPQFNTVKCTNIQQAFWYCNNLSDASIQNIINMCLNSNVASAYKNLNTENSYSPFNHTNITSSRYSNRLTELSSAGWSY